MRRETIPVFTFLFLGFLWITGCSSYQQGLMQAQRNQYPAAIEHFEKALQSDPGDLEARRQLGHAYLKNDQRAETIEQFRQVSFWGIKDVRTSSIPLSFCYPSKAGFN